MRLNYTFLGQIFTYLKFVKFNLIFFKKKIYTNNNVVLIEFNSFKSYHVGASLLGKVLSEKFNANIEAYLEDSFFRYIDKNSTFLKNFLFYVFSKLKIKNFNIYYSFGVNKIFYVPKNNINKKKAYRIAKKFFKKFNSKNDLVNFKLDGVLYGDLIYDSYLKYYKVPTLNLSDKNIFYFFYKSIEYFFFWKDYFKNQNVCGVIAPQSTYISALPLRIAATQNKISLVANPERLYNLNKKRLYSHKEFIDFNRIAKTRDVVKLKKEGTKEAKRRLKLRFSGMVGIDISYLSSSPYERKIGKTVLKKSNKIKVLIAPHSFYDSPHSLGNHLFSDYYDWLEFVFKISKSTNYEWYVKCHPKFHNDYDPTISIVQLLCKKYKHIKYIDNNISHHQLILEEINYVFTCNGTIGLEYPYFDIPVINASKNNPHYFYNFNYNPKSKKELKNIILNLNKMNKKINKNKILEFYFIKNIYFSNDWLFDDFQSLIKYCGDYRKILTSNNAYKYFLNNNSLHSFTYKIKNLKKFINSGDYIFNYSHKDISLEENILRQKNLY